MDINSLDILENYNNLNELCELKYNLFKLDSNNRNINIYKLLNVRLCGESLFYPNNLIFSQISNKIYYPIRETTMSLKNLDKENIFNYCESNYLDTYDDPLFFFIFNMDNYYHFLYDTLPYLITYRYLKKIYPNIKLLVNYPNPNKKEFYRFNIEFFELLDIQDTDLIIANKDIYIKLSTYLHHIHMIIYLTKDPIMKFINYTKL